MNTENLKYMKAVMDSLAGFCHALGQPATVLLSSVELLKMEGVDDETKKQVLDICQEAVLEIKSLLAEMKTQREYLSEAYLKGSQSSGTLLSMKEWHERPPP